MKLYSEIDILVNENNKQNEVFDIIGVDYVIDDVMQAAFACRDVKLDAYNLEVDNIIVSGVAAVIMIFVIDLKDKKVIRYNVFNADCSRLNVANTDFINDIVTEQLNEYFRKNETVFNVQFNIKDIKFM